MLWNDHWRLEGQHAYLGASKHHWINYDETKLRRNFVNQLKAKEGTELHEIAKLLIKKKIKLRQNNQTFNSYVNDAIGFGMDPEVPLAYNVDRLGNSDFFGTPDAMCYRVFPDEGPVLRIHDLKTGTHLGRMEQLRVYAALFFLEYGKILKVKPHDVKIILRIYQNDTIVEEFANPAEIIRIMDWGRKADKIIKELKEVSAA